MRKKYFALLMVCMLTSSVFMSGCGRAADAGTEVEEADEEDEDEDEEDDDRDSDESGDEEAEPQKPTIVTEIDDDTLASQLEVFLNDRDEWVISAEEARECDTTYYAMTDLNVNGRAELIVGNWIGKVNFSTVNIYEINEKGDGFEKLDWSFTGVDAEKKSYPEVSMSEYVQAYYDKDANIVHYLFTDFYLYSFTDGGIRYCDLSLQGDTVVSNAYAMGFSTGSDGDETDTYYLVDGEVSELEYYTFTSSYPRDYTVKPIPFGFYFGDDVFTNDGSSVQSMDREELGNILTDSYHVFAGVIEYDTFYNRYRVSDDYMTPDVLLNVATGSWGLYMTDTEGDITYYEPGDDLYATLDVNEDMSVHVVEEAGTEAEYAFDMNVFEHGDGSLMGDYMPPQKDGRYYDELVLSITGIDENGMLVVTIDTWAGRTYLGGSTWYFERLD